MLYNLSCVVGGANTGRPRCADEPGMFKMAYLIPKGKVYTETQVKDILTVLKADAKDPNPLNRVYPIGIFVTAESTSTEVQRQTFGYGTQRTVRRGTIGHRFTIVNGGKCYHQSIMAFDRQQDNYDLMYVDENGLIDGTDRMASDKNLGAGGFSLSDLYVSDYSLPDGTNGGQFTIEFQFADAKEWNERFVSIKPASGNALTDVTGLKTITLQNIVQSPVVVGTYKIKATSDCGKILISQLYASELDNPALWDAVNVNTGGAITITSITAQTDGTLLFVLDTADADFDAGVAIKLSGPTIAELEGVSILGYEMSSVVLPNA